MNEEEKKELAKKLMAEVYADGFNIYKCLNKLKKNLKLVPDFPPEAIIWTCQSYLSTKIPIQEHYPWFVRVFTASSQRYFSEQHEKESQERHKDRGSGGMAQSVKDILKGL